MERQPPATGTIFIAPDPPPFPAPPRNVDFTPLEFILSLLALVTIPALIYTFFLSLKCPPSNPFNRTPRRSTSSSSSPREEVQVLPTVSDDNKEAAVVAGGGSGTGVRYNKEAHVGEIGSECPVCLSGFKDGEEVKVLVPCKHSFHAVCVDLWLSSHSSCPVCRAPVPSSGKPPAVGDDRRRSGAGGRRRDVGDDLQQGMPDASSMV